MNRLSLLKSLSSLPIVGALFSVAPTTPPVYQHARPGDVLIFRVDGGPEEVWRISEALPNVEGVTMIVVNQHVEAHSFKEYRAISDAVRRELRDQRGPMVQLQCRCVGPHVGQCLTA